VIVTLWTVAAVLTRVGHDRRCARFGRSVRDGIRQRSRSRDVRVAGGPKGDLDRPRYASRNVQAATGASARTRQAVS
jgi:hypothetical protein